MSNKIRNSANMFANRFVSLGTNVTNIKFKKGIGYLSEAVDTTVDQVVSDDECIVISPIVTPDTVHEETTPVTSIGEKIYADDTGSIEFIPQPAISTESFISGVPYLDDLFGENEGEVKEFDRNASEVPANATEQYVLDTYKLMFDKCNEKNAQVFLDASKTLALHVGNVYKIMTTDIAATVERLVSEIDNEASNISQLSGSNDLATYLDIDNLNVNKLNWNELSVLGSTNNIINRVKQFSNSKDTNMLAFGTVRNIVTKLTNHIDSASIPDNTKNNIINKVALKLDGVDINSIMSNKSNVNMIDETDEANVINVMDNDEKSATESIMLYASTLADIGYAPESLWTDTKRKISDLFTSTETQITKLENVDANKYRSVKPDDLSSNKVVLLNKNFAGKLYTTLNSNYLQVNKLAKMLDELPPSANENQMSGVITIAETLAKSLDLKGQMCEETPIRKIFKDNSTEQSVKNSDWKIVDISIIGKLKELNTRYKSLCSGLITKIDYDKFMDDKVSKLSWRAAMIMEWHAIFSATLLSNLVKTCLRVIRAYDDALGTEGTENSKQPVSSNENLFIMDDLLGEHEGENNEQEKNASEISKEAATEIYNIITSNLGYSRFVKQLNYVIQHRDTGKQIRPLMDIVVKYPKVLDAFKNVDLNISNTDTAVINRNIECVTDALNTVGLYLLACRKYFADNNVLVIDQHNVNPDTFEMFVRDNNGSMEDISRHLLHRYVLTKTDIPYTGIRISEISNSKSRIAEEHFKLCDETKKKIELNNGGAQIVAYNKVLTKYLETVPSKDIPVGMSMNNFVRQNKFIVSTTSNYLKDNKHSVDECIYRFLFDLWYRDKPVYKQMYNRFESKYKQLFNSSLGDITKEQRLQADAEVIADTILGFVMDKLVTK